MTTKPSYTSVCELHTFNGKDLPEAMRRAADFIEETDLYQANNLTAEQYDDGEWVVSFTGDYLGNTTLSQMERKK